MGSGQMPSLRTRTSRTYKRPDGSRIARVFSGSVNYRDPAGTWRPIDTVLHTDGDRLENGANAFDLSLPTKLGDPVRVTNEGMWVEFGIEGADPVDAEVAGREATFRDAFEGVDVIYTSASDGVKEDVILADARAPTVYRFGVSTSNGLRPEQTEVGGIDFVDRTGQAQFSFTAPSMRDAEGELAPSSATDLAVQRQGSNFVLQLRADRRWLAEKGRAFPVTLDPDLYTHVADQDCQVESDFPDQSFCSAPTFEVGADAGPPAHQHSSLLRFSVRSVLPRDAVVLDGELWGWLHAKQNANQKQIGVHRLTRPWTNGASWNKYDGINNWTVPGGDYEAAPVDTIDVGSTQSWQRFDVTSLVSDWVDGGNQGDMVDHGLILKDENPSVANTVQFASREWGDPNARPHLDIVYEPRVGERGSFTFASQRLSDRLEAKVNVGNGNLLHTAADVKVPGVGLDLGLTRYYNSGWYSTYAGQFGMGATASLGIDVWLRPLERGSFAYYPGSGSAFAFRKRADGTFITPPGIDADLKNEGSGRIVLTFRRSGTKQVFQWGSLAEIHDRHGKKISMAYSSSNGALQSITDTQGRVFAVTTNSQRYITQISDPSGRSWTYTYGTTPSTEDHLQAYTDPAGKTTSYGYDSASRMNRITTPGGRVTRIGYDSGDRVTSMMRVTDTVAETGPTTSFEYDTGAGRACNDASLAKTVVKDPLWSSGAALEHTTTYCHNRRLEVRKVLDGNGNLRETTYNPNGNAMQLSSGGSGGSVANLNFDESGASPTYNLTGGSDASGRGFSLAYDAPGQKYLPSQQTNAQGKSTMFEYDGATSGGPGNLTRVYSGQSPTQVEAVLGYVSQSDPEPRKRGLLSSATDGKGNVTSYAYNNLGQLTTVTPPQPLGQTSLTYDSLGRVKTVTDGKGQMRTYTYDRLDRTTKIDFSGGSYVEYGFDEDGNALTRLDAVPGQATKTTAYEYDLLGRLKKETLPGSKVHNYTYDAASNVATFNDSGGTVTYHYDPANRLKDLAEPGGTCSGTPSLCTTFSYDNRDNLTKTSFPNGAAVDRTFDLGDQVTRITARKGTDPALVDLEYSYTDGTRTGDLRTQVKDRRLGERTEYSYDFLDRLTRAESRTGADGAPATGTLVSDYQYTYDKASNRTSQIANPSGANPATTSYGYNAVNQLCWNVNDSQPDADCGPAPANATTYTYDANGNETAQSGGRSQSYNIRNQTTVFSGKTLGYGGPGQQELVSDDTATLQNSALGVSSGVLGATPTYWTRTPDGGLVGQRRTTRRYYVQDALGSTVALLDAAGAIKQRYTYEPYGKLTNTPKATNPFRYAGGYATQASGSTLYHFSARHYDPALGRWTQTDPLDQAGDLRQANAYAYADADPANLVDPSGTHSDYPIPGVWVFCATPAGRGDPDCNDSEISEKAEKIIDCAVGILVNRIGGGKSARSTVVSCAAGILGL